MMRKMVVVGDRPAPGGAVLPYSSREYSLHGHQVALIGGGSLLRGLQQRGHHREGRRSATHGVHF